MLHQAFEHLAQRLVTEAERHYGERLVSLAIFGSVARGAQRFDSDLDVLVVCRHLPAGRMRRVKEFEAVERALEGTLQELGEAGIDTRISPVFKTPAELDRGSPLLLDMVEDAWILRDHGRTLAGALERLRRRLSELGARRVWRANGWHWVLKKDFRPGEVFEL